MADYDRIKEAIEALKSGQCGESIDDNVLAALKEGASYGGIGICLLFVFGLVAAEEYAREAAQGGDPRYEDILRRLINEGPYRDGQRHRHDQ